MEELRKAVGELFEEFGRNEVTVRASQILDRYILVEQRGGLKVKDNKQVIKDEDIVSLAKSGLVTTSDKLYKHMLKIYIEKDQELIKKDKWEAMMLVTKCNEYIMMHEMKYRKSMKQMTEVEKNYIKERFFKEHLEKMSEEKADRLIKQIDVMFNIS